MHLFKSKEATVKEATVKTVTKAANTGDVTRLVAAMRSTNPDVRRAAIDGLARIHEPDALTAVLAAVHDPDWRVRDKVVGALAAWAGDQREVGALLDMAMHDDIWAVRRRAVETLAASDAPATSGDASIVEPLIHILWDSPSGSAMPWVLQDAAYTRQAAAKALGRQGDLRAVDALLDALRDDAVVRGAAAVALIELEEGRAVDPLLEVLRDPKNKEVSGDVVQHVVQFLRQRGEPRVKDALLAGYADSGKVSRYYTSALVDLADGDEAVVDALIAELGRHSIPSEAAARGLARLGNPRAVDPLVAAFQKSYACPQVLDDVAEALVSYGEPGINAMLDVLPEEGWGHSMRREAATALEKIGDPRAAVALVPDPAERARLTEMRTRYHAIDYSGVAVAQLTQMLQEQFAWMDQNEYRYREARPEFDVREVQIVAIGAELNRRGGEELMRTVHSQVQRDWQRHLERSWSGIGGWLG
jgi:HEAT repeat protein